MAELTPGRVLVTGASGAVGGAVLAALAPYVPGRLVVGGRDVVRAEAAAARVGPDVRAVALDAPDALDHVAVVVACAPDPTAAFAARVLERAAYVDITADPVQLAAVEALAPRARGTAVLSVGLAPGLTTLLAAVAAQSLDTVERIDVGVLLGLGDAHGGAAIDWTLDGLRGDATIVVDGAVQRVPALAPGPALRFRPDEAPRATGWFPFPEAEVLARTLGARTAGTGFALDPAAASAALAWATPRGVRGLLRRPRARRGIAALLRLPAAGSDACAVAVRVQGTRDGAPATVERSLDGREEARVTAVVAAETVRLLLDQPAHRGVVHLHELDDPTRTLGRMVAACGLRSTVHAR